MTKASQHVVPHDGKWSVRRSGAARATRTYESLKEAIAKARDIARHEGTALYVHGLDGRIRERHSYAKDPKR